MDKLTTLKAPAPTCKSITVFKCYSYELIAGADEVPLVCHIEYDPGTPDTWAEPGDPGCFNVFNVYMRGVDLIEMLSPSQIETIKDAFIDSLPTEAYYCDE
jgi:hypothetical protein